MQTLGLLLYRLILGIYHLGIRLAAIFSAKAHAWDQGRRGWEEDLQGWRSRLSSDQRLLWMHCASLGEFEQGRPVLEAIRQQQPHLKVLLSFYSPSGFEQRKDDPLADHVTYLPTDTASNARRWLEILQPDLVIWVKYEFWLFHLRAIAAAGIPAYLIAASFRPGQLFFRRYGGLFRDALAGFRHIFVQQPTDAALLASIDIRQVTAVGDPRVDRVIALAESSMDFPLIADFVQGHQVLIAGSTWPPDEDLLIQHISRLPNHWKLIIAPHNISPAHINQIAKSLGKIEGLQYGRYTERPEDLQDLRVLVLDTIGMLSRLYRYGHLAYIGGGFGAGIHNTLEPAAHGLPVLFGPKHQKFPEATRLQELGAGFVIDSATSLGECLDRLTNAEILAEASKATTVFLDESRGATQRILNQLLL